MRQLCKLASRVVRCRRIQTQCTICCLINVIETNVLNMRTRRYAAPTFLNNLVTQAQYERWLTRKAAAHVRRDRRKKQNISVSSYKKMIHDAVCNSNGCDDYTGEHLDWTLISKWRNDEAKRQGPIYKKKFALLPSVDHVTGRIGVTDFKICSWRMNDAKNDLSIDEFIDLAKKVLHHLDQKS